MTDLERALQLAEAVAASDQKEQSVTERPTAISEWIFIVGMPRSGSTWVYNVISETLISHGAGRAHGYVGESSNIDQYLRVKRLERNAEIPRLIKFHSLTPEASRLLTCGLAKAIYSQRDLRHCGLINGF